MSIQVKSVPIVIAADGTDAITVRAGGIRLIAVRVELGTLTSPHITIKEQPADVTLLGLTDVVADGTFYPSVLSDDSSGEDVVGAAVPVSVFDRMEIAISGAGEAETGRLILMYER